MRLIDADKLQAKHYLQRSEHPIGYEGTQAVYDYTDVLAYDIESAETVEAIPTDWIKKKSLEFLTNKNLRLAIDFQEVIDMWKVENNIPLFDGELIITGEKEKE